MVIKEYAMAYKELIEILKYVSEKELEKIPKEKMDFYKENMDNDYEYQIDETKEFEEQEISEITKALLANIFRDYWATPYQKERIKAKEKYDLEKLEEEKRKKYSSYNIFKNKDTNNINIEKAKQNLPIKIKKENFFKRLIAFIKGIFEK